MDAPWFPLVLGVLATWRLTHLLVLEDGPWDAVLRLRQAAGAGGWGRMLDCFYCLSLWVAAALTPLVARSVEEGLPVWLALSGAACLLQRLGAVAPVTLEPFQPEGESDGLLWTPAPSPGDPAHSDRSDTCAHSGGPPTAR